MVTTTAKATNPDMAASMRLLWVLPPVLRWSLL